jgi:hypothetical protein
MSANARRAAEKRPWDTVLSELETHYSEAVQLNERFNSLFPQDALSTLFNGNWKNHLRRLN